MQDASGKAHDYRATETKLTSDLSVPPDLISAAQKSDEFYQIVDSSVTPATVDIIPSYQVKGLAIKSNLAERWLEMDTVDSQKTWQGLSAFLESMGYKIKSSRKDIGVIETEFTPRKVLIPLDDQSPLTKLLNSWRPEFAEGAYDRLVARLETSEITHKTRIYFYHSSVFAGVDAEGDTALGNAKIKPSNPMFEAEALYQAMIFFGAAQADALQQIEMTENRMELTEGNTAFDGLKFKASTDESWSYLKTILYRANWSIDKLDSNTYQAWAKVPTQDRQDKSVVSKLAFWRDSEKSYLPEVVSFRLTPVEDVSSGKPITPAMTLVQVRSLETDAPLDEKQRLAVFDLLGLLEKK